MIESQNSGRIGLVSLGCPKALVDSEVLTTQLCARGYQIVGQYAEADLVIINTCGFIESAIDESLECIGDALTENGRVIVIGCLGKDADRIRQIYPQVLAIIGPGDAQAALHAVETHLPPAAGPFEQLIPVRTVRFTPKHYAYLKISEGCNQSCSFCIIPSMRGRLRSFRIDQVLKEATYLRDAGVKELLVISQDTGAYGSDIRYRTGFVDGRPIRTDFLSLCKALSELGIWVRLHYLYPYPHIDPVLDMMQSRAIVPYLDVPLQHASPAILKKMRRPANVENVLERIEKWRTHCPDVTIRSTFIVGFPGESEQDFERLLSFLQLAQLDRVGSFMYSAVEGAAANQLPNPVPEAVAKERQAELMRVQQDISVHLLAQKVGQTVPVLVDHIENTGTEKIAICRSYADAPEIDGEVQIRLKENASVDVGQFLEVKVMQSSEHDLFAQMID